MQRSRLVCLLAVVISMPVSATTITVDPNGDGDFAEIQPALDAAPDGSTVLVQPGEYLVTEPLDFNRLHETGAPKCLTLQSLAGPDVTVIRVAEPADASEAVGAVVFQHGETRACVLRGFTISGGRSDRWPHFEAGGGILCVAGSSPTVEGCVITGNICLFAGCGGVYCGPGTSPEFLDCDIVQNGGSGVYCYQAAARIVACRISANQGMGIYDYDSHSVVQDCEIRGNGGTGVDVSTNSTTTITRCSITGNYGNAVFCGTRAAPEVTDCLLSGNRHAGISCEFDAAPRVTSSTISHNYLGGVLVGDPASPVFTRCTITANLDVGVSIVPDMPSTFRNCIVWGNLGGSFRPYEGYAPDVQNSCVEGEEAYPGPGNIRQDPQFCGFSGLEDIFVDAAADAGGDGSAERPFQSLTPALDYSLALQEGSPCRGAGEDGVDMGDDLPICETAGVAARSIHVAAGTYLMHGLSLIHHASLRGAGRTATILEGEIRGLRTGSVVEDLTVTRAYAGITVEHGQEPTIRRVTVQGNKYGGVNCLHASPVLEDCIIAGNYVRGLYCRNASPTLTNCAVWGNWTNIDGGGVYLSGACAPVLSFCTITGNVATRWGTAGVVCTPEATPVLRSCIVWNNTPQVVCGDQTGCVTDADPQFRKNGTFDFERTSTHVVGGIPMEFPDYVVEAPDLRLEPGSPAIDTGDGSNAPDHDLDGQPRPQGAGYDAGAYEFAEAPKPVFVRGEMNGDGDVDLSDMIVCLLYLFRSGEEPECLDAADLNDDSTLNISDPVFGLNHLFTGGPAPPAPSDACACDPTDDDLTCNAFALCDRS